MNTIKICVIFLLVSNLARAATPVAVTPTVSAPADASSTLYEQSAPDTTAVGKAIGGTFQSGVTTASPASARQVISNVLLKILGFALQAFQASTNPPNTINGVTYTEVYSFGKRVFQQSGFVNYSDMSFNVGLAPTEIRVPLVKYPVGPVTLSVDGGARFQADLQGALVPNLGIPLSLSSLGVQVETVADGAGFIEGYVSLLVVRAGVGGQVDLVDASANLNTRLSFDGSPPFFSFSAMIDFLSGRFYAFADYFNFLKFSFTRFLDYTIFSWKGYCFQTGGAQCP